MDGFNSVSWGIAKSVVLEEPIVQDECLARFHPSSCNHLRITTINIDNDVKIVDAWLRVGMNGNEIAAASIGEIYSGINLETGVVETDGFTEFAEIYGKHPNTGVSFRGSKINRWEEVIELAKKLSTIMPSVRYVGWDLTLTKNGWIIVEANENGEFLGQLIYGKPYKEYINSLIGIAEPEFKFWWKE